MESPYRFVVWEVGEVDQRGLVIDPKDAKLLDDVAQAGSAFDQFVKRRQVQSLLGWVGQRLGRLPTDGPAPPLMSKEDEGQSTATAEQQDAPDRRKADEQAVRALLEQGLCFSGNCPSCGHSMRWAVPFGVLVDPGELVEMVKQDRLASAAGAFVNRWPWDPPKGDPAAYAGSHPGNPTITFVCACGCQHDGRPADAVFVGCGAAWNQRMRGNETESWNLEGNAWALLPATPGEADWAAHIKELAAPPLARIRATANQWRNGVTGLTTVLTAVALLSGSATASEKWHPGNKAVTLGLAIVGFTLLLMGTFTILSASIGVSGYDHRLLATHALRRYERKRGRDALGQIRKTQFLVLAGVAFIAASGFFAFANPNLF